MISFYNAKIKNKRSITLKSHHKKQLKRKIKKQQQQQKAKFMSLTCIVSILVEFQQNVMLMYFA